MRNILIPVILFLAAFCSLAVAAGDAPRGRSGQPISVKSNELFTDSKSRTATFTGKVVAKQQDVSIFADKLVVYYPSDGGDVDRVEASGNVRIVQQNRLATAGHAVYNNREGKITLSESPRIQQGKDVVSGSVITYMLDEEKSVVKGGPERRVEVMIYPKEKGKDGDKGP
jgi:lipopolysaccharide export system protein LptA